VPPGLDVAVVSDSMVVSAGWVGEGLGAIRARVGLLSGVDILMCFEVELGRKALTAVRADNGANLQVNRSNVPLHQTRARLEAPRRHLLHLPLLRFPPKMSLPSLLPPPAPLRLSTPTNTSRWLVVENPNVFGTMRVGMSAASNPAPVW